MVQLYGGLDEENIATDWNTADDFKERLLERGDREELTTSTGELIRDEKLWFRTPLSVAAGEGQHTIARLLTEKSAEPDSRDSYGRTLLSWVVMNGHEEVVELLLEKGARPHLKNSSDRNPLSRAAKKRHESVVELLKLKKCQLS